MVYYCTRTLISGQSETSYHRSWSAYSYKYILGAVMADILSFRELKDCFEYHWLKFPGNDKPKC